MTRIAQSHKISLIYAIFMIFLSTDCLADLKTTILGEIAKQTRILRPDLTSLKEVPVPEPSNLYDFVKDKQSAIELGKALFWDMQVGSDNVQACGSCHFSAGADNRTVNQLSPGLLRAHQDAKLDPDITFDPTKGTNYQLKQSDFPLHLKADPFRFDSTVLRDTNDVVSSQGVSFFDPITPNTLDPDGFSFNGVNTRRVEPRNTPTVINAVFNYRQFWDGRASNNFNGVNPMGENDPHATVYILINGVLLPVKITIDNASLASQAVGPPVSSFEMSVDGRTWTQIGNQFIGNVSELDRKKARRLYALEPLSQQIVDPTDSVLGKLAKNNATGLKVNYVTLIQKAFKSEWWSSQACVRINADGSRTIVNTPVSDHIFSQMEMNFSLFFGLAVQLYEATLVSDDTPVDRYLEGDSTALSDDAKVGLFIADKEGRCINCHDRAEFTRAATSRIKIQGLTRIREGDLIDEGFNNIGVRPTLDDLGVGGVDELKQPLSFARKLQLDPTVGTPEQHAANLAVDGAFKIPTLRNVELTAPYFHNGSVLTLEGVIDFYFRGGNFRTYQENTNVEDEHPIIGYDAQHLHESPISGLGILSGPYLNSGNGLDAADKGYLVAFLKALTDERVRYNRAPFDHPEIKVPNGHPYDPNFSGTYLLTDYNGKVVTNFTDIPAVGASGYSVPLPKFIDNLSP